LRWLVRLHVYAMCRILENDMFDQLRRKTRKQLPLLDVKLNKPFIFNSSHSRAASVARPACSKCSAC
jgi:hypothetical protein